MRQLRLVTLPPRFRRAAPGSPCATAQVPPDYRSPADANVLRR